MTDAIRMVIKKDNSAAWSQRLRARVATELQASAMRIEQMASDNAPRDTGALADSGEIEALGQLRYAVVFGANLDRPYAIYQELGTSTMPAQPYLYPAFRAEMQTLVRRLAVTTQGRVRYTSAPKPRIVT